MQGVLRAMVQHQHLGISPAAIIQLAIACDFRNACPTEAWLTDLHLRAFVAANPSLFPAGILVKVFYQADELSFVHFQHSAEPVHLPKETVAAQLSEGWNPAILGLVRQPTCHFVQLSHTPSSCFQNAGQLLPSQSTSVISCSVTPTCARASAMPLSVPTSTTRFEGGSSFGSCSGPNTDLQVCILVYAIGVPDDVFQFASVCKALRDTVHESATLAHVPISLLPCACKRLCTNQALLALSHQQYPVCRGLRLESSRPKTSVQAQRLQCARTMLPLFQTHVWIAQDWSPCLFTSSISLSTDLQNLDSVDLYIGFVNSACAWSLAEQLATGFISNDRFWAGRFKVNYGICSCFKWVTTEEELPVVQIPTISLARPLRSTVVLSRVHMTLFDAEDRVLTRLSLPSRWQVPTGANSLRAFVAMASGDDNMLPLSDTSAVTATLATTTDGAWLAKRFVLQPTPSSVNRCCAHDVLVTHQDIRGGASTQAPVLVQPEHPAADVRSCLSTDSEVKRPTQPNHRRESWADITDDTSDICLTEQPSRETCTSPLVAVDPHKQSQMRQGLHLFFTVYMEVESLLNATGIASSFLQAWQSLCDIDESTAAARITHALLKQQRRLPSGRSVWQHQPLSWTVVTGLAALSARHGGKPLCIYNISSGVCLAYGNGSWHRQMQCPPHACDMIFLNPWTQRHFHCRSAFTADGHENDVEVLLCFPRLAYGNTHEAFFECLDVTRLEAIMFLRASGLAEDGCMSPSLRHGCTPDYIGMLQLCCCTAVVPPAGLLFLCSSGHFLHMSTRAVLQGLSLADATNLLFAGAFLIYVQLTEQWICRAVIKPTEQSAWCGRFLRNAGEARYGRVPLAAQPHLPAYVASQVLSGACCHRCPLISTLCVDGAPASSRDVHMQPPSRHNVVDGPGAQSVAFFGGADSWKSWESGEGHLCRVRARGSWDDGTPVGRGWGQPYLQPKYARLLASGSKTIEGRPSEGWVTGAVPNDWVTFKISASGGRVLVCRVLDVHTFDSFQLMLQRFGVSNCLPDQSSLQAAVDTYYAFANRRGTSYRDLEHLFGVTALHLAPLIAPEALVPPLRHSPLRGGAEDPGSASVGDVPMEGPPNDEPSLNFPGEMQAPVEHVHESEEEAPQAGPRMSTSLLHGTPQQFNEEFRRIFISNPRRASVVSRYLVAHMVKFPEDRLQQVLPEIHRMTQSLARKAGCPFEWAFLLFLPVLATSCSSARLFINEFFLVPPLLWIGLCLDSGANKSGVLSAIADIITGFEKHLLAEAEKSIRQEQADAESDDDDALGVADEARAQDQRERAAKRRKVALNKKLASLRNNQPQIFCDEGSLPAIGMQMYQNRHRAVGLYDEGRFLLRALAIGEGSGFNPATMSKLFNGASWKRTVVKDHNRFVMAKTCLCLAMTFHVEEWHAFLEKDEALGMQSRFLMFHSAPRLDKAAAVLEQEVYEVEQRDSQPTLSLPAPLLQKFVELLAVSEVAHCNQADDYDRQREYIPYFFATDALERFTQHYDAQVLAQESSYLSNPKLFSRAGKLKSLPWRLALLLHVWSNACAKVHNNDAPWSRKIPANLVQLSGDIFDYLSLQSQILSPNSDLLGVLSSCNLLQEASQKFPYLTLFLEKKELPLPPPGDGEDGDGAPTTFDQWWDALDADSRLYAFLAASWVLSSTTTLVVDRASVVKKLHNKDSGEKLPSEHAKTHVGNAFQLLHYAHLAVLRKKGTALRVVKQKHRSLQSATLPFCNLLKLFRHKHAANAAQYNEQCVVLTDAIKKQFKADAEAKLDDPQAECMNPVFAKLSDFVTSVDPFEQAPKVLKQKMSGGASSASLYWKSLLYPANVDMLPAFIFANLHADKQCCSAIAAAVLAQTFAGARLTETDCAFVFDKLHAHAPHLLKQALPPDSNLPRFCIHPHHFFCQTCTRPLKQTASAVVPFVDDFCSRNTCVLRTFFCSSCSATYFGPWQCSRSNGRASRYLLTATPAALCPTSGLVFASAFLSQTTNLILHCGATFRGLVQCIKNPPYDSNAMERVLRDAWLQHAVSNFLGVDVLTVDWGAPGDSLEAACSRVLERASTKFQRRWLVDHCCSKCVGKQIIIDGNAKVRTRLCANTDAGVWNCKPLKSHCLTGCTHPPLRGSRFCAIHQRDAEPIFGSDLFCYAFLCFLCPAQDFETLHAAGPCTICSALRCSCRRVSRALHFAMGHAHGSYPVRLQQVKRIARTRQYTFLTPAGNTFTLCSKDVPFRFQEQHAHFLQPSCVRECQLRPRVGDKVTFTAAEQKASCRAHWTSATKQRRSGGLLCAVRPCQIIAAVKLLYTHESPTGVYFFLAELLAYMARIKHVVLSRLDSKARRRFVRSCFPLVVYDCACTLYRFIRHKKRVNRTKLSRAMRALRLTIDKFHFRSGHTGCRSTGSRPLPAVWPSTHACHKFNTSSAEEAFVFVKRIAVAARRMTPKRGFLFVLLLLHERNLCLERLCQQRDLKAESRHRSFRAKRSFEEMAEGHLFCHAPAA